ncbi:choice-of-anchor L domain-containing protein [Roseovarius mucosus]|uniref:choice-of-anchor L domain-containing protein n=1 Tax=Roseovarius mucosus TaxID=215743 RepID=UPI001C606FBE|nr:choice-of-anchor L domain-containing protein [Roseovarius mucosus]MBW4972845.1 choice-of-anchor L domain-containing protein [Roseovarius mucosus]
MATLFTLTGFQFITAGDSIVGLQPATLELLGSDDLQFTYTSTTVDPTEPEGDLVVTQGDLFETRLEDLDPDFFESQFETIMAEVSFDGAMAQFIGFTNDLSGETFLFQLDSVPLFAGPVPTETELAAVVAAAGFADIPPGGPFSPGVAFSPNAISGVTTAEVELFPATNGNDTLIGFGTDDAISGLDGDDFINGQEGQDTLLGDGGNDSLFGNDGNDLLNGGLGADILDGGFGLDVIQGSAAELDGDSVTLAFGDEIRITGLTSSSIVSISADSLTVSIDIDGDGTEDAAFSVSPFEFGATLVQSVEEGTTTLRFSDAPAAGIGLPIIGPSGFDQIADVLVSDPNLTLTNVAFTGAIEGIALLPDGFAINRLEDLDGDFQFETVTPVVNLERGVFLTTGSGPGSGNTSASFSEVLDEPGDADLDEAARDAFSGAGRTNDASVITFTFDATDIGDAPAVSFDLFFGSDEFPEFVNSQFVDIAAVFVNGQNFALFNNDPGQPLSIVGESINTPGNFFNNNGVNDPTNLFTGQFDTEYDGFSRLITVIAPVQAGLNEIKIGIADTGDFVFDSGLFIGNMQASNFNSSGSFVNVPGSTGSDQINATGAPELIMLGGGEDTVSGTAQQLDGDIIDDWQDDDLLEILGSVFGLDDIVVTLGSAILDVDTDGDGVADTTITLEGDFSNATFNVENSGGNTTISSTGAQPEFNIVNGTAGSEFLPGTLDNDSITGGDGNDSIPASDGNDIVFGGLGNDNIGGGLGNDTIDGGEGDDIIGAGFGDDSVTGGAGNDVVAGGAGDDTLEGGDGNDSMSGSFGNDLIDGGEGADDIGGGTGRDTIDAGAGNDSVGGGEGDDSILGGDGNDFLAGGGRNDTIDGGAGNDTINAGAGNDVITGGTGADQFVFSAFFDGEADVITDFEDGLDSFFIRRFDPDTGVENINNGGNGLAGFVTAMNIVDVTGGAQMTVNGNTILVEGITAAQLTVDDFTFL